MKSLGIVIIALALSACSALPTMSKIAPTVCSFATSDESQSAARALIEKMPAGPSKDRAILALQIAEVSADAGCTAVKALEAKHAAPVQ